MRNSSAATVHSSGRDTRAGPLPPNPYLAAMLQEREAVPAKKAHTTTQREACAATKAKEIKNPPARGARVCVYPVQMCWHGISLTTSLLLHGSTANPAALREHRETGGVTTCRPASAPCCKPVSRCCRDRATRPRARRAMRAANNLRLLRTGSAVLRLPSPGAAPSRARENPTANGAYMVRRLAGRLPAAP